MSNLHAILINAHGLSKEKLEQIAIVANAQLADLVLVTETHLRQAKRSPKLPTNKPFLCRRKDRPHRRGGGVAIYHNALLPCKEIALMPFQSNTEALALETKLANGAPLAVLVVYHPDGAEEMDCKPIKDLEGRYTNLIVGGDFNATHTSWNNRTINVNGTKLNDFLLDDSDLTLQQPDKPTFYHYAQGYQPSTIDLFLCSPTLAANSYAEVAQDIGSDHKPVILHCTEKPAVEPENLEPKPRFKEADWQHFSRLLATRLAGEQLDTTTTDSIDRSVQAITRAIMESATDSVPYSVPKRHKRPPLPRHIVELIRRREQILEEIRRGRIELRPERNQLSRQISREIRQFRDSKFSEFCTNFYDPVNDPTSAQMFKKFKALCGCFEPNAPSNSGSYLKGPNGEVSSNNDKVEVFRSHLEQTFQLPRSTTFDHNTLREVTAHMSQNRLLTRPQEQHIIEDKDHDPAVAQVTAAEVQAALRWVKNKSPGHDGIFVIMLQKGPQELYEALAKIYSAAIQIGHIPETWKLAITVMIPKPGKSPQEPGGYRPISLLPTMAKLLERIVARRLYNFIDRTGQFTPFQSGFRREHSTLDHQFRLAQFVTCKFNENRPQTIAAVMLDVEKAFDSVWRDGLLFKLKNNFGVPAKLLRFIANFVTDRTFKVRIGVAVSSIGHTTAGVPQGSPLSPLLYLSFVNDLNLTERYNKSGSQFADDMAVWTASSKRTTAVRVLQQELNHIVKWCNKWQVKLNPQKSQLLLFERRQRPGRAPNALTINGTPVPQCRNAKFLGVTFDSRLNYTPHINSVRSRCSGRLKALCVATGKGLQPSTALRIYATCIRPITDFGAQVWRSKLSDAQKRTLEAIQHRAIRAAYGFPYWAPRIQLLETSKLPRLEDRAKSMLQKLSAKWQSGSTLAANCYTNALLNNQPGRYRTPAAYIAER